MKKAVFVLAILVLALGCEKVKETTVSGTVTNGAGGPVSGAIILLLESSDLEEGMSLSGGSVSLGSGNYEIIRVDPGNYYVPAIKDVNGNATLDSLDLFGYYGPESTFVDTLGVTVTITLPEQISVSEGESRSNIDIDTLYTFIPGL